MKKLLDIKKLLDRKEEIADKLMQDVKDSLDGNLQLKTLILDEVKTTIVYLAQNWKSEISVDFTARFVYVYNESLKEGVFDSLLEENLTNTESIKATAELLLNAVEKIVCAKHKIASLY